MEDGVLSPATMLGVPSDSAMDMDFMDELFLEGCWLETREGSEFLNQTANFIANPNSSTTTNPLFDPLFSYSTFEPNNITTNPSQKPTQHHHHHQLPGFGAAGGSEAKDSTELSRSLWIGPKNGSSTDVIEKLYRALAYIKDVIRDKSVLVQIWVPVDRQGRRVLSTRDLPFAVDDSCQKLASYRDISVKYQFLIDDGGGDGEEEEEEESKELVKGLPGRVFSGKVPEWTPDVRFFRKDEYPRLRHAKLYDVRGTLALPVFEHGSRNCLGVVEVVMTTQKIKYRPELESVCKALEAVDLKSSEVLSTQNVRVYNKYYLAALPEIQEVLRSACETHRLPLAQTWVPCVYQDKEGCRHSDENLIQCVSTVDCACYVADPNIYGFHEACSEHHLFKGQGVVGSAFMTNQPCFSADITSYPKTEYPLSHHAMVFNLHAAVAIRLRSIHTGAADFVLEFFLPVDCTDPHEQMKMLNSLSLIIQQCCRTLRVVTDKELEEEESKLRIRELPAPPPSAARPSRAAFLEDAQQSGAADVLPLAAENLMEKSKLSLNQQRDSSLKASVECTEECSAIGEGSFSSVGVSKTGERRRTKAEKTITLQVLRQYFAGSLKDAAKSIGVCSTTLKRICRQHGIKRWPSRKIKKVGHSLQKLQLVIDSVQGASGAFQIDSFYSNFPELASPNVSGTSPFSASKPSHRRLKPSNMQPEGGGAYGAQANAATSKSSSSCSQSSSSSQCCTSRSQQHHQPAATTMWNVTSSGEDQMAGENSGDGVLKRVRSEAELNKCNEDDEATKTTLPRSQSQRSLFEHRRARKLSTITTTKGIPPLLKSHRRPSQEGEFQRVKVTFGDEKTRFRMHNDWGFVDLQREIARRFGIQDMGVFTLKYLDDDSEWVLLTCIADLEECFEVCRTTQSNTIKLSLQVSRHVSRGFLGQNGPS